MAFQQRTILEADGVTYFEVLTDLIAGADLPFYKLAFGAEGELELVSDGNGLPVVVLPGAIVNLHPDDLAALELVGIKGVDGVGIVSEANPVPVTGTVNTGGLSDAELRATPVPFTENPSDFWRMEVGRFTNEEVKYDFPAVFANNSIYMGINADATLESAPTWKIIRTYFDANGFPSRKRFRANISWTDRANAANWP